MTYYFSVFSAEASAAGISPPDCPAPRVFSTDGCGERTPYMTWIRGASTAAVSRTAPETLPEPFFTPEQAVENPSRESMNNLNLRIVIPKI